MRLVTPIAPSPATHYWTSRQATVRHRAQRCLTTADEPPAPLATARLPSPNERSANRPPASEATLPDYSALRYTLIIYYPPPQLIAHKNTPSLFLLLIKTSLVFSYCPRKSGPLLTFAHEFSFNYQEKLNNAPSAPIAPSPATPRTCPQATVRQRSATPGRAEGNRPHASSAPPLLKYPRRLKLCPQKYALSFIIAHQNIPCLLLLPTKKRPSSYFCS